MTEKEFLELFGTDEYRTWVEASDDLECGKIDYGTYQQLVDNSKIIISVNTDRK